MLDIDFPDPSHAPAHGLLAVGGSYEAPFLLAAYSRGIFPWPSDELPHAWFSPDPRTILQPHQLHIPRSLRRVLNQKRFRITFDCSFEEVMERCAEAPRREQDGTWITPELMQGFVGLHRLGFAHSVEAWQGGRLAGGLYGVSLGAMFCAESMFFQEPNASKVALVRLVQLLERWRFSIFDCQIFSSHVARFGAREIPRHAFLRQLERALERPTRRGSWDRIRAPY